MASNAGARLATLAAMAVLRHAVAIRDSFASAAVSVPEDGQESGASEHLYQEGERVWAKSKSSGEWFRVKVLRATSATGSPWVHVEFPEGERPRRQQIESTNTARLKTPRMYFDEFVRPEDGRNLYAGQQYAMVHNSPYRGWERTSIREVNGDIVTTDGGQFFAWETDRIKPVDQGSAKASGEP